MGILWSRWLSLLRRSLVTSFGQQWLVGKISWPRSFSTFQKLVMRCEKRTAMECRCLCIQPSSIYLKTAREDGTIDVGDGLVSHLMWQKGEVSTNFKIKFIPLAEADRRRLHKLGIWFHLIRTSFWPALKITGFLITLNPNALHRLLTVFRNCVYRNNRNCVLYGDLIVSCLLSEILPHSFASLFRQFLHNLKVYVTIVTVVLTIRLTQNSAVLSRVLLRRGSSDFPLHHSCYSKQVNYTHWLF